MLWLSLLKWTKIGVVDWGLKQVFLKIVQRSMFDILSNNDFLKIEEVPTDKEISVREAPTASSAGHGKGMVKCSCKKSCDTNRCKCKNAKCPV